MVYIINYNLTINLKPSKENVLYLFFFGTKLN